jgi:DNA-binding transcriptional LysR family regulator
MRVLREVAVRGSFSAAAEALSFTQSAISQQIAALERETGATLVERSARGVRLTDAGRALVKHTDAILARLTEAESELEAIAGLRGGRVRMAAFESAAATLMPPAIAAYRSRHPAVELSMTLSEPEDALPQLRAGELELAVIFGGSLAESYSIEGLELLELLEDPLYLVLPADHPLARKRNIRLSDLAHEPWIGGPVDCECTALIRRSCAVAGYDPRITFEIDDYHAVQGLVAAGVGVSLIAEMGLSSVREDIVVRSLGRDTPVRRVYAAVHDGGYRSPATAAMLDVLREVAERLSARRPELELVG